MFIAQYLTFFVSDTLTVDGLTIPGIPSVSQTTCSTDLQHPRPYMMTILEGIDTRVDLVEASVAIGAMRLRVQDTRTTLYQESGWLTALLRDAGGKNALIGQRVAVKLVDQFGTEYNHDLLVVDIGFDNIENTTVYSISTRDIRERERTLSLFYRSEEAVIWPSYDVALNGINGIGSRDGYGKLNPADPASKQLIPPSKGMKARFRFHWDLHRQGVITDDPNMPWGFLEFEDKKTLASNDVIGGNEFYNRIGRYFTRAIHPQELRSVVTAAGNYTSDVVIDGCTVEWRPWGSTGAWTALRYMPVWFYIATGGFPEHFSGIPNVAGEWDPKAKTSRVDGIYITAKTTGLPTDNTDVEVRLLSGLPPSEQNPIYYEGTFGNFLKKAYDGDYSVGSPGIRYNATVMADLVANTPIMRLIKTNTEREGLAWLQEHWYKVMRMIPLVNDAGEIVPTPYSLPNVSATLVELNDHNVIDAGWQQTSGDAITGIEFTYHRDYVDLNNRFATIEVHADRIDAPGTSRLGSHIAKFAPETVRDVTNNISDSYDKTKIVAELGFSLYKTIGSELIDRFSLGGQHLNLTATRSDADVRGLKAGDWVITHLSWLPDLQGTTRGCNRLGQIVHINDIDPTTRSMEIVDAGPFAQPLPVTGASDTTVTIQDTILSVVQTNVPAGYYIRVDIASTATGVGTPGATDPAWQQMDRATGATTLTLKSGPLPLGWVWIRVRFEQPGRRPGPWRNITVLAVVPIPQPTGLSVSSPSGTPTIGVGTWTAASPYYFTDVFIRFAEEAFESAKLIKTLDPGAAATWTATGLVPSIAYTFSVQHRNSEGVASLPTEYTFVAGSITLGLNIPNNPTGFAGTKGIESYPLANGIFGLAVIASEFPSSVEFFMAVETGVGSGTYGTLVSQAIVPSVQGGFTLWWSEAVNKDGLRRRMTARHVRAGATPSAQTAAVDVLPWTPLALVPPSTSSVSPGLNVVAFPGTTSYTIVFGSITGTLEILIDGTIVMPPATITSPIVVARPAAGAAAKTYTFRVTAGGLVDTETVQIPAIDQDVYTPEVQLLTTAQTSTTITYSGTAKNPLTGAAITIEGYFEGVSGTFNGGSISSGGSASAVSPVTIVANRPAIGSPPGTIRIRASVGSPALYSQISRTVSERTNDFEVPYLNIDVSQNPVTYTITYSTNGAYSVYLNNVLQGPPPPTSPIVPGRNPVGGLAKNYTFVSILNNQQISKTVMVEPQIPLITTFSGLSSSVNYSASTITVYWSWQNRTFIGECQIWVWDDAGAANSGWRIAGYDSSGSFSGSSSFTYSPGVTLGTGGGPSTFMFYIVAVDASGNTETGRSGTYSAVYTHY